MKFHLFTDIFTVDSGEGRVFDVRVKIIVASVALGLVLLSRSPLFPLMVFAGCALLAVALKAPARLMALRFGAPLGLALMILVLKAFLTGSEPVFTISVFSIDLTATREGIEAGVVLAARCMGALAVVQLLSVTTPAHRIFRALRWFGAPHGWVEIAMLMYRYTFELFEHATDVASAQKVRLGYAGARRSLASAGTLAGAVTLRSVDQAQRAHEAMVTRGYNGVLPFDTMPKLSGRDMASILAASVAIIGLFMMVEIV